MKNLKQAEIKEKKIQNSVQSFTVKTVEALF